MVLCVSDMHRQGKILTNPSFVIAKELINRAVGAAEATNCVGTILVASTDVMFTLVNVYIYKKKISTIGRSLSGIASLKHANTR